MADKIQHFTDPHVWRKSHQLFLDTLNDMAGLPRTTGSEVISKQLLRSVGSISANIAEGFNRTRRQFLNHLEIAKGSAFESENWYYKLRDCRLMEEDTAKAKIRECIAICKMIQSLVHKLSAGPDKRSRTPEIADDE